MAWAAAIPAAASIIGDIMSSGGQSAANQASIAAAEEMQARQFQFADMEMQKGMDYDTQMSNTAEQRRVADLKAAGLNPLLAATAGAASAPVVSTPSGSAPTPTIQNPNAAFGSLGGQVSSAMSVGQQQQLTQAQADNIRAQTAQTLATLPYSAATAEQNLANAREQQAQIHAQANNLFQQYDINANNFPKQFQILSQQADFQNKLQDLVIKQNQVDLEMMRNGLKSSSNSAAFQSSLWGRILNAVGFGPGGGASGAAGAAINAARTAGELLP